MGSQKHAAIWWLRAIPTSPQPCAALDKSMTSKRHGRMSAMTH
jgi:hypothetical protein